MMASNPKAVSTQQQHYDTKSPLDQIVNGTHSLPSRHTLLERAVTLTRKNSTGRNRALLGPEESRQYASSSSVKNHDHNSSSGGQNRGYQLRDNQEADHPSDGGSTSTSRQRVQDLRAARLSQIHSAAQQPGPSISSSPRMANERPPISNAFRDSIASDISFNSISGPNERQSMAGTPFAFDDDDNDEGEGYDGSSSIADDPDRIAEAVRGLTMRRRQSIDTVRSSEFGEGGRWDRAWGGSDGEEDDDDDRDNEGNGLYDLGDVDIESNKPKDVREVGGRPRMSPGRDAASPTPQVAKLTPNGEMHMPALQDASNVHHIVNLTPSMQKSRPPQQSHLGQDSLQRRDTIMSMAGDIGQVSPNASSRHQHTDSSATIGQRDWNTSRQSFGSDNSQVNAHVYVWPPTPAASEHGGSSDGQRSPHAVRDRLQARRSPALGMGQQATIEYYEPVQEPTQEQTMNVSPAPYQPASPSTILAQSQYDGRNTSEFAVHTPTSTGSRHPTGRAPPNPPSNNKPQANGNERYADPNKPLPSSPFAELGRTRRKAIEDHDGRDSLVSDLDVETLRLDGSNGSEDWASRRGSISTLGSFSSEKIRDQRQRMSDTSMLSGRSDKRGSTDTIRGVPASGPSGREGQHRSWNGVQGRPDEPSRSSFERNPKRSNTGPDSYNTTPASQMNGGQSMNHGTPMQQAVGSVTFATPKPNREAKKPSVIVKGAIQQSQAEKFLTLAITHHESGDLSRSAYYFERSAKVGGGCVVGMCMWGMALREGWGVRKDERKGFDWISRAAARAGEMMAGSQGGATVKKSETEINAIRSELKLAVYELGKCFCYGWGVKMDKPMALEYFELAAKLGDADAQAEAGALLAAGKGCKKDLKKAAAYYRMAESQGYDTVGLSWIHKSKYDPVT